MKFNLVYNDFVTIKTDGSFEPCTFLVDTQADVSIFKCSSLKCNIFVDTYSKIKIKGITNSTLESLGTINLKLFLKKHITHAFHLVSDEFNIKTDGILGKDFLNFYNCLINYQDMSLTIDPYHTCHVFNISQGPTEDTLIIPARCETVRCFKIETSEDCVVDNCELAPGVYLARTIVNPEKAIIRVINTTDTPQIISKTLQCFEPLSSFNCYSALTAVNTERCEKIKNIINNNTPKQFKLPVSTLIDSFSDVFALPDDKMTINNFYSQKFTMSNNTPIYTKNYRTPYSKKKEIEKQVNKLIENDLIETCTAPYNSPIILVPKKSTDITKKWRMCIDYRKVNKALIPDRYPLPRIDDILDNLGRAVFFSVLDLYNGFHQIPIEKNSRDITAFSTEQGNFRWKVLPFGLSVSPNSFVRMMNLAFSGLPADSLFIYMDDIIVLGKSEKDHIKNLETTFARCREKNLKLNPNKCHFFKTEVLFLGHICSKNGIKPDPSKFASIQNYPTPYSSDCVRRFVAMVNYYRKFIDNFSIITIPLNNLTKKNVKFHWTQECQNAFNTLKNKLCHAPILAYPDYEQEFVVTVDASKSGVGAVISQNNKPIAFASKSFSKADRNKITIEQELIAIHWAIKHFKHYLFGTHFTVRSDHRPLVYLFNLKDPTSKLTRLRLDLAEYDFTIEHIPGKENVVADALSRLHITDIKEITDYDENININIITRAQSKKHLKNNNQLNNQPIDTSVPKIIQITTNLLGKGIPYIDTIATNDYRPKLKVTVRKKFKTGKEFFNFTLISDSQLSELVLSRLDQKAYETKITQYQILEDDPIFDIIPMEKFKTTGNLILKFCQIFIVNTRRSVNTVEERSKLIQLFHDDPIFGGHQGINKLYSFLRHKYKWRNMYKDVKNHITTCIKCQQNKPKVRTREAMTLTDTPQQSFDKVSIDTIGPLQTSKNDNKYVLTIMCDLTKYLIAIAVPSKDAKTIAKAIIDKLILVYGPVKIILTDRGTEFVNEIFQEVSKFFKAEHRTSTPYHHQTLGAVERSHRTFNEYLRIYLKELDEWEDYLDTFVFCHNISNHSSFNNKLCPYELVYGRKPNFPESFNSNTIDPVYNIDNYAKEIKYKIQLGCKMAKKLLENSKIQSKSQYDKALNQCDINIGDKIFVLDETRNKFSKIYNGPFLIKNIDAPNVSYLDTKFNKIKTVHKNNVIKCKE